jgi:hypothetical protein
MTSETTTKEITVTPTMLHPSLVAADDVRQRRMDDAARYRQVRLAKANRRFGNPRGEPTHVRFRLYHLPRWLVAP